MLTILIIGVGSSILLGLFLVFNTALKRNLTKEASVEFSLYEAQDGLNPNFVWIKFNHKDKEVALKYYYNTSIFKHPQDFYTLNKTVTVKFEDANPENFAVIRSRQGDYLNLLAAGLIGGAIGIVVAANQIDWFEKFKMFLIAGGAGFVGAYMLSRLSPFFDFLNYFRKNEG
jgi:hypothetical protein